MKKINLAVMVSVVFFSGFSAMANKREGFACIPSLRETNVTISETEQGFELSVSNPSGYEFMPQFEGPSSAYSISFLKMQSEDLRPLGSQFKYTWPKEKCEYDKNQMLLSCQGEATSDLKQVKAFSVSTTEISEKTGSNTYHKRKFRLMLENENSYFLTMIFFTEHCFKF